MHVLHPAQLRAMGDYVEILHLLAEHDFPFLLRNYHGQSLADLFFAAVNPRDVHLEHLRVIISRLKPHTYDLSYLGTEFGEGEFNVSCNTERQLHCQRDMDTLLTQCRGPIPFFALHSGLGIRTNVCDMARLVRELERDGSSALIHIVNEWPNSDDKRQLSRIIRGLVRAGAEVRMRDKNGDTALAITARRGLRPAVLALLSLKANPNTRDYQGIGMLSQATKCLLRSQKQHSGKQYARILSCMALLIDYSAKESPTVYDEWFSHAITRKQKIDAVL
jgi:hypothetical protein